MVPVAHQPYGLMGDVVPRTEQVGDLIVAVAHDRLLERDDVGPEPAQAVGQDGPALVPRPLQPHRLSVRTRTPPVTDTLDGLRVREKGLLRPVGAPGQPRGVLVQLEELHPPLFAKIEEPELGWHEGGLIKRRLFTVRSLPTEPTPVAGSHSTS